MKIRKPTFNRVLVNRLAPPKTSTIEVADTSPFCFVEIVEAGPTAGIRDGVRHHTYARGEVYVVIRASVAEGNVGAATFALIEDEKLLAKVDVGA